MLTRDKSALLIFEDFRVDVSLPKFQNPGKEIVDIRSGVGALQLVTSSDFDDDYVVSNVPSTRNEWMVQAMTKHFADNGIDIYPQKLPKKPKWYQVWKKWPFNRKAPEPLPALPAPAPPPEPELTIKEFFSSIKNSASELLIIEDRAVGLEKLLTNAKKAGQHALIEKVTAGLRHHRMEVQLVALGLPKFVEEAVIVDFVKKSPKGLELTWISNFGRTIPEEIVAMKVRADEIGIFDNYVVLHYDPKKKSLLETEAEKEARKDPILFGVMKDRRSLYVVGDWVDELCDLTLDQLAEHVGREAIQSLTPLQPYR